MNSQFHPKEGKSTKQKIWRTSYSMNILNAISLFSSSGIGDLGLHANSIKTVIACELLDERMELFKYNNPDTKCFCGDIWELRKDIINYYKSTFKNEPFIILADYSGAL